MKNPTVHLLKEQTKPTADSIALASSGPITNELQQNESAYTRLRMRTIYSRQDEYNGGGRAGASQMSSRDTAPDSYPKT